ncbi:uncharacterized protein LOC120678170 [Panicum virgatum]|uniref:uncharacterized protein LOC120678170 n=1 Tax=Panicum virgatum TaxID=38727 RepID=UPI0019D65DC9|nr:uncharacterized protein LOC120678170 [Panicum virgatum]
MAFDALSSGSSSSDDDSSVIAPQPAPASVVQRINIRQHVLVLLDLPSGNYGQWCCLFQSVLGKFGLDDFVCSMPPIAECTAEWRQIDQTLVNWIYTTVNKSVFDIGLFLDNELHRAVYLEAELRSTIQGDSTIDEYCTSLKRTADKIRDIGQPISKSSQVLNLLHRLNPKYRHVKPVITSKRLPHTFQSARSFLALEELQMAHEDKLEAG